MDRSRAITALGLFALSLALVSATLILLGPDPADPAQAVVVGDPSAGRERAWTQEQVAEALLPPAGEARAERLQTRPLPRPPRHSRTAAATAGAVSVDGTVRDTLGRPVEGAWVAWTPPNFPANDQDWPLYAQTCDHDLPVPAPTATSRATQTDADGHFRLPHLPGRLRVQHPDLAVAMVDVDPAATSVEITLAEGTVLAGAIVGAPPGARLDLISVATKGIGPSRGLGHHRLRLPSSGGFRLTGLAWGRTQVQVVDGGGRPLASQQLTLQRDALTRLELDLGNAWPLSLTVEGRVADVIQDLLLRSLVPGRPGSAPLTRDEQGRWIGAVDWTGATEVLGMIRGLFPRQGRLATLELVPSRDAYRISVAAATVRVHIDVAERPPYGVPVTLRAFDQATSFTRQLSAKERVLSFEHVPPGRYLVSCRDGNGQSLSRMLRIDATTEVAQVVLDEHTVSTQLLLLNGAGRPAEDTRVELHVGGTRIATDTAGADGRLTFSYLPPGPFAVTVVPFRSYVALAPVVVPRNLPADAVLRIVVD